MNKSRKFLSMVLAALLTLTFLSGVAQATVPAAKDGVVIATAQEPTHFFNQDEQYLTSQAKDGPVLMQLYDTLYWMGEDGSCQPSLATSYEVSDDGMEYVFELRDDVYFHNGEKMTAEDVAFTYNLCVEKNAQLTKNLLMNFKEAQVVDDTHVKMVLSSPFPAFLAETTSRVGFVICKSYYEQVGSEGYNTYPHEMDGGRRQRVGLARALVLDPKFIVCDEPVSALDVSIQAQILNLLMDLQEEKKLSYMFITHDLCVVRHISHQIMVMYMGQVVEYANKQDIFDNPVHPYTKALLSAIPVPDLSSRNKEPELLKGEVANPINPAPGCRFAPRCPYASEKCKQAQALTEIEPNHFVACHECTKAVAAV